ncbi:hypothetical protein BD779DRAFT_1539980 [Infundibulicybe gibba]|nr:hypothetical protein BD779DRAFT_1539980 [Infundibulicybe gibba]
MDNFEEVSPEILAPLSYDDTVAYEEQLPADVPPDSELAPLANRIGTAKVYLLSEASTFRAGKVRWIPPYLTGELDVTYRANALLLHGTPISHLPTAGLFAYATHFDAHPLGLEWVDDNTCVFVFESKSAARGGFRCLQKSIDEEQDVDGFMTAKPIPIAIWPPRSGLGLKGVIRMRWAMHSDVKRKGANKESEFYRKHGTGAGKEPFNEMEEVPVKRRRMDDAEEIALQKARLDDDLDEFLAEADEPEPVEVPSPPSKMRSDYISNDGRTLLQRTSQSTILGDRLTSPLPRRALVHGGRPHDLDNESAWTHEKFDVESEPRHSRRRGGRDRDNGGRSRRTERPRKTQEQLDAELDAFLNEN